MRGSWLESHFRWQIRTFWFTALWLVVYGLLIITIIGMMIVPLHHFVLDLLLTVNISFAVILLLISLYIAEPIKLALYLAPFIALSVLFFTLYRGERAARETAASRATAWRPSARPRWT